jgi:hypothetical protein
MSRAFEERLKREFGVVSMVDIYSLPSGQTPLYTSSANCPAFYLDLPMLD